MISLRNFALRRGERLLLSNVDLTLHAGYRVGVVGRNGAGKSSLFAAVQGELEADKGDLDLPGKVRIASVAQETPSLPDPALSFVLGGDTQVAAVLQAEADASAREDWEAVANAHQKMAELGAYDAEARAGKLLHGLGFPADTHHRPVSSFSGGWRVRLNLARALMMPSDLLLLDEPTNHLDMDAVLWLEQWLLKYPGTLLLISHDREFLDNVATHTLHLHGGGAKLYTGGYTDFERQRAEQLRQQQIAHEKEQAERAHLQSFIDRFKAKASKAAQAQSRMKRLAKLAGTEAVRAEREFRIEFAEPAKLPFSLIRLNHVEAGYGPDAVILHDVGFGLEAGQRIGLLGPNGAGKTTLVKTLVGELPTMAGDRMAHPDLRIGYFAQHTVESLHEGQSPMDHFRDISPDASNQSFRDFLGKWNFPGDRAFEPVQRFFGCERARLALALDRLAAAQRAAARRTHQPPRPGNARSAGRSTQRLRRRHRDGVARPPPDRPGLRYVLARGRWRGRALRRRPGRIRGLVAHAGFRPGQQAATQRAGTRTEGDARPGAQGQSGQAGRRRSQGRRGWKASWRRWMRAWPNRRRMPTPTSPRAWAASGKICSDSWPRPRKPGRRCTTRLDTSAGRPHTASRSRYSR